jgi:hypothetical protein
LAKQHDGEAARRRSSTTAKPIDLQHDLLRRTDVRPIHEVVVVRLEVCRFITIPGVGASPVD